MGKTARLPVDALADVTRGVEVAEEIRRSIEAPPTALKPLLLVGAGVSSRVGLPTWGQLMDKLHAFTGVELKKRAAAGGKAAQLPSKRLLTKTDYLWRAQYYCEALGSDRFEQFVAGIFSQPPTVASGGREGVDLCMDYIVRLPVSHVLTTNYDTCLDGAHQLLRDRRKPKPTSFEVINVDDLESTRYFIQTLASPNRTRYYVHLHGRVDQRDSMVLTDSSYRKRYLANVSWSRTLYSVFSTRQLVCVGFSASDPDLTQVLREISTLGAGVRHYAIVGVDSGDEVQLESRRLEQKFGITPLIYRLKERDSPDRHANLETILAWLCGDKQTVDRHKLAERNLRAGSAHEIPALAPGKARSLTNKDYPDDPRRDRFGGLAARNGLRLSASVTPDPDAGDWFTIELKVSGEGSAQLDGRESVEFFVHPSFARARYEVRPSGGVAKLTLSAYGAFTAGVTAVRRGSRKRTALELNLADLPDAPPKFKMR